MGKWFRRLFAVLMACEDILFGGFKILWVNGFEDYLRF